jgi:sugar phosphate isomerase/epimerase
MATKGHTFKYAEAPWRRFLEKVQARGRTTSELVGAIIMLYIDDEMPENAGELEAAAARSAPPGSEGPLTGHTFKLTEDGDPWGRFLAKCKERGWTGTQIIVAGIELYMGDDPADADAIDKAADSYGTKGRNGRPPKNEAE